MIMYNYGLQNKYRNIYKDDDLKIMVDMLNKTCRNDK